LLLLSQIALIYIFPFPKVNKKIKNVRSKTEDRKYFHLGVFVGQGFSLAFFVAQISL